MRYFLPRPPFGPALFAEWTAVAAVCGAIMGYAASFVHNLVAARDRRARATAVALRAALTAGLTVVLLFMTGTWFVTLPFFVVALVVGFPVLCARWTHTLKRNA